MAKTKVFKDKFGKHNLFSIYPINEGGEKLEGEDTRKVVTIGIKKAKAILDHMDELKTFVDGEGS